MIVARRRLLQTLTLAGGGLHVAAAPAVAQQDLTLDTVRAASAFGGRNMSDARLAILKPVLARRLAQVRVLRSLDIDDTIGPSHGIV